MVQEYVQAIRAAGGKMPNYRGDPLQMQIAKLDDALRKTR